MLTALSKVSAPQGAGVVDGRATPTVPPAIVRLLESMLSRGALTVDVEPSGVATRQSRIGMYMALLREAVQQCPPGNAKAAFALVNDTLNAVENRFSGQGYDTSHPDFRGDGRMYPILGDLPHGPASAWIERPLDVQLLQPLADCYQTKANHVLVGANGAIEIWLSAGVHPKTQEWRPARCVLRLPGLGGVPVTRDLVSRQILRTP